MEASRPLIVDAEVGPYAGALLDALPHKAWIADSHGAIVYLNVEARQYLGRDAEDFLEDGWLGFTHPEDALLASEAWATAVRTGEPCEVIGRLRRADGAYRWHLGRTSAMRDTEGRVIRWLGTFSDVHERQSAALALAESEQRAATQLSQLRALQTLLTDGEELTGTGSWYYDATSDRVQLSPGAQRLLGIQATEVSSREVRDRFDPADVEQIIVREVAGTAAWQPPALARTAESVPRTLEVRMSQHLSPDGELAAVAGTVQDVTARETALADAKLWAEVAEHAPIGLLVLRIDPETGAPDLAAPVSVNRRAQGYEPPDQYLSRLPTEEVSRLLQKVAAALAAGTPVELDEVVLRHDELGKRCVVSLIYPLGAPDLIVMAGIDVTESRRAQAERDAMQQRSVEAAETERHRIGAQLHDEVLQLLVAALMRLDDADKGELHRRCQLVSEPLRAAVRGLRLSSLELVPAALVGTHLRDAIEIYAEHLLGPDGPELELSVAPMHEQTAPAVRESTYRIAQEALSNAARHARATRITVVIGYEDGRLVGEIRDNGIGRAPDVLGDGSLGIGLMQQRAHAAGGALEVVPSPGGGTAVCWWLPLGFEAGAV